MTYVDQITSPLLLVHGELDPVVPIKQSEEIKQKIEARGGVVKLVAILARAMGLRKR